MSVAELKKYGLEEMREEEISQFLASQSVGVLGLPTDDVPYLVPLSFAFDGEDSLFFTYLRGEESRKETLTEKAAGGRFLVYEVNTLFNWESVVLKGRFQNVPPSEWTDMADLLEDVWRPEIFQTANTSRNVAMYEFEILDATGIKHTGLAPGFDKS